MKHFCPVVGKGDSVESNYRVGQIGTCSKICCMTAVGVMSRAPRQSIYDYTTRDAVFVPRTTPKATSIVRGAFYVVDDRHLGGCLLQFRFLPALDTGSR